ncbi:MAG: HNH endonuclease signature motif containing protein [Proteobacteria bacterium]|nr:HNH endonuclease signature motif containing protein [Pseudomonadota bacterium]
MKASIGRCLLTGEVIPEILEAAHIIPVENGGSDETANGICLRKDIHGLFDAGHIRLTPAGELIFTKPVMDSENYKTLPRIISIPNFVNPHNVDWRYNYLW